MAALADAKHGKTIAGLTVSGTGTQRNVIDPTRSGGTRLWLFAAMLTCLLPMGARATQTKSFVFTYFYPANYYGEDTCPEGLNPLPDVFFKRDLKILGLPQAEVNAMFDKDYKIQNEGMAGTTCTCTRPPCPMRI
jgi:hypothetical protein